MIPYIILNKIYLYIWLMKQRGLCVEYHKKIKILRNREYVGGIMRLDGCGPVAILSKNY